MLAFSAISATSLFGQAVEFDSVASDTDTGNSGSFTIDNTYTAADSAYVVFGYAREGGAADSATGQDVSAVTYGGNALNSIVETKYDLTNGAVATMELWGSPLDSLAAGNLDFSVTVDGQTDNNGGANFFSWIVTGVNGITDQAGTGVSGEDNGGGGGIAGTFGFNDPTGDTMLTLLPDQFIDTSDSDFSSVLTNDLILALYTNGNPADGSGVVNNVEGLEVDIDRLVATSNGGYTSSAYSGLAASDAPPIGVTITEGYFRAGLVAVSLDVVPEPSSYALIAGALTLALASFRRRLA